MRNKTKLLKNVCAGLVVLLSASTVLRAGDDLPNGRDLVRRSLQAGERNEQKRREYVSRTSSELKQFADDGTVKSEETKTYDDIVVDGFHVRALVAKDDKPLAGSDRVKEQARIAKLVEQRKNESPRERDRRLAAQNQRRAKDRRFYSEVLDAFKYRVVGQESVGGRPAWVLDAVPNPSFQPQEFKARILPHLRGRIWVDKEDLLWVKAEADGMEPFGVGFSLVAKLDKGAHLSFEQIRVADGTWVVRRLGVKASGRIALVKRFSIESVTTSGDFRKVPLDRLIEEEKNEF